MADIIVRAGCFLAIVALGWLLRRIGVFGPEAFSVLSKVVIKLTLPAAIISSFVGKEIDISMLTLSLLGLGGGLLYMALGWLLHLRHSRERKAFEILNYTAYNVGNFTLPFAQGFLGPMGVITASLFDVGNAVVCLGGAFSVAVMVRDGCGFSLKRLVKTLLKSVPFVTYLMVVSLSLLRIPIPGPVAELAEIVGSANAFVAMLMIGVGFKMEAGREQMGRIFKTLAVRYSVAAILAAMYYFLLPFDLQVRQSLVIMAFAPISMAIPAFTAELEGDVGLSSAVNSLSILISIVIIVALLTIML